MIDIPRHHTLSTHQIRRVILESPYRGDGTPNTIAYNVSYARACVHDSLLRGEAPLASHLLYTQPGILNDADRDERAHGINAGHAWLTSADAVVVYTDLGMSDGMEAGINLAGFNGIPVERRQLKDGGVRLPHLETLEVAQKRADDNAKTCQEFYRALQMIFEITTDPVIEKIAAEALCMSWLAKQFSENPDILDETAT